MPRFSVQRLHRLAARLRASVFLSLMAWAGQHALAETATPGRPNIVFILLDDVAWSDLGCYGNRIHDTPNMDRLAQEGMQFTQAYAPAPICSASRCAFLTGKSPARLRFEFVTKNSPGHQQLNVPLQSPPYTMNLPLKETTMAESLAVAGYRSGFYGKWHVNRHHQGYLGWSPTHGPRQQGFEEGDSDFGAHPYAYRKQKALRDQPTAAQEFPSDSLTSKAIEFIERHRDQRFFLHLSHYFAHDPIHTRCQWLLPKYRARLPAESPDSRTSYAAMIETLDHLVGRLLRALDEQKLNDRTMVVLTSDNGGHPNYTSNAPLRGSKWNLYEGGIRVPLLVRWPSQIKAGAKSRAVVHGCDWLPTFAAIAGTQNKTGEVDQNLDGVSLLPILEGRAARVNRNRPLVWHFPYYHPERNFHTSPASIGIGDFKTSQTRPSSALRSGDWKLLWFHEDDRVELYDLVKDIGEQNNLASVRPLVADDLRRRLRVALLTMQARFPTPRDATP